MEPCIFCKIVRGEAPCMKVFEDEYTLSFMDLGKDVDGHILVIPKKHAKNVLDCDHETLQQVISTVKTVTNHLVEHCGYEGVNVLNASDESAGQSVNHLHMHIIPRKRGDGIDGWPIFTGTERPIEEVHKEVAMESFN